MCAVCTAQNIKVFQPRKKRFLPSVPLFSAVFSYFLTALNFARKLDSIYFARFSCTVRCCCDTPSCPHPKLSPGFFGGQLGVLLEHPKMGPEGGQLGLVPTHPKLSPVVTPARCSLGCNAFVCVFRACTGVRRAEHACVGSCTMMLMRA